MSLTPERPPERRTYLTDDELAYKLQVPVSDVTDLRQNLVKSLVETDPQAYIIDPASFEWSRESLTMTMGAVLGTARLIPTPETAQVYAEGEPERVAIKIFRPQTVNDTEWNNREIAQSRRASRLLGPERVGQVLKVKLAEEPRDFGYLVMKWYETSLQREMNLRQFTASEVGDMMGYLADTTLMLHDLNPSLYQWDMRPANVLLEKGRSNTRPLIVPILMDFGISNIALLPSEYGKLFGQIPYTPPELLIWETGGHQEIRDFYGLAVMLYQIVQGSTRVNPLNGFDRSFYSMSIDDQAAYRQFLMELRGALRGGAPLPPGSRFSYRYIGYTSSLEARGFTRPMVRKINALIQQTVYILPEVRPRGIDYTRELKAIFR